MSNIVPVQSQTTDFTAKDMEKIQQFQAEGLPGLARLKEDDFHRMTELYMNGSTYWQISTSLNISRALVMYMSHTYGWYPARQEYLAEMQEKIKGRIIDSNLASEDFLLLLIQAYQKKLGTKLKKYLATDETKHADEINLKEIDKLFKAIEIIESRVKSGKSVSKKAAVELGLKDFSGTIERSADEKLTITSTIDRHLGDMLKKFADKRRAEDNKNNDIKEKQTKEEPKNET
jgi:hypothetical protein